MDNLQFGIPKKAKKTKEWNFMPEVAAIKIAADRGAGKPKKVYLNELAHEMLFSGVTDHKKLGVSFDLETGVVRFANAEGMNIEYNRVTKNPSYKFSDSKMYNFLTSFLKLDTSIDNFYILVADSFHFPCGTLTSTVNMTSEPVTEEVAIESNSEPISVHEPQAQTPVEEPTAEIPTPASLEGVDEGSW